MIIILLNHTISSGPGDVAKGTYLRIGTCLTREIKSRSSAVASIAPGPPIRIHNTNKYNTQDHTCHHIISFPPTISFNRTIVLNRTISSGPGDVAKGTYLRIGTCLTREIKSRSSAVASIVPRPQSASAPAACTILISGCDRQRNREVRQRTYEIL